MYVYYLTQLGGCLVTQCGEVGGHVVVDLNLLGVPSSLRSILEEGFLAAEETRYWRGRRRRRGVHTSAGGTGPPG